MSKRSKRHLRKQWLIMAVGGLLLCGFGLSLLGEAILAKSTSESTWVWIGLGTSALVVFNSGLCIVVRAGSIQQKISELN